MKIKRGKYHHLSGEERSIAYSMRDNGASLRDICRALGRPVTSAGSLSREFKRNIPQSPITRRSLDPFSLARFADERARERRKIPRKNFKLESDRELREFVEGKLQEEQASPRDISWRVDRECCGKSLSHTAIYDYTKRHRGLIQYLRRHGKPLRQRVAPKKKPKNHSAPRRCITERSVRVAQRVEFGHFEADTIVSARHTSTSAILTLRELRSRNRWYFKIPDLRSTATLALLRGFFSQLPPHMRRSLTIDNGPENKELYQLERVFSGFRVYHCEPYCAWQRGSVENANGEFRWYFPKGTDFQHVPSAQIRAVQDKLNRRCMECLGGRPAGEVFSEALLNPPRIFLADAEVLRSTQTLFEAAGLRFERSSNLYVPSPALWG